jgi:hypothetical protein
LFTPEHIYKAVTADSCSEDDPAGILKEDFPDLASFPPERVSAHGTENLIGDSGGHDCEYFSLVSHIQRI